MNLRITRRSVPSSDVPLAPATTTGIRRHQYWILSCAGALLIGVTFPTLLVCWNHAFNLRPTGFFGVEPVIDPDRVPTILARLQDAAGLEVMAMTFCGPLAVIFAFVLYLMLCGREYEGFDLRSLVKSGMSGGISCAFLNFPGYLSAALLDWTKIAVAALQLIMLFAVAGATCGAWIAWQAYRRKHPDTGIIPAYRLVSLLQLILAWGFLLALFSVH